MLEHYITEEWTAELDELDVRSRDIYFTPEYVRMHVEEGSSAECFVAREGQKLFLFPYMRRPVALMPEGCFDVESPYGYGGPITNAPDSDFTRRAFDAFCGAMAERGVIAAFIRFHPLLGTHANISPRCELVFDRKTVGMDLTHSVEDIWMHEIHPKHRNKIRKAEAAGLTFEVDEHLSHLDEFVEMYNATMTAVGATPFYFFPRSYYEHLRDNLRDQCFLAIVRSGSDMVASSLFMRYGVYGHYHLSGSSREHLALRPNNFLVYRAALYMKGGGIEKLHLGGGSDTSESNSLFEFKQRFSSEVYDFFIGKVVIDPAAYAEACDTWERDFGEEMAAYRHFFLRYRQLPEGR